MQRRLFLFFLTLIFALTAESAELFRRTVEFEWGAVEGADSYDLEILSGDKKDAKPVKFSTTEPLWEGPLVPGLYKMKIRARDRRGVPGDWSEPEDFKVGLDTPKLSSPQARQEIQADSDEQIEQIFSWDSIGGAESYNFELISEDGTVKKSEKISGTSFKLSLPVAKKYSWTVSAQGMGMESEKIASDQFSILGKKLKLPTLEKPDSEYVRNLNWQASPHAASYKTVLLRRDPVSKTWEKVEVNENTQDTQVEFSPKHPGGKYRFQVLAQAPLRASSPVSQIEFKVKAGDRSPAAQETATLRMSIDRLSGWYSIASYLVTMINYKGINFDRSNSALNYSAIGGVGRLGAGYLSPKSAWGFLGIADLGGITVANAANYTYASLEANGIYRSQLGERGELRQQFGAFYKELPETTGKTSNSITAMNLIKAAGPHYGIEYWYALNSRWGFQLNSHIYPNLIRVATPNGQDIQTGVSTQFGLLGSYRLQRNLTGLAGYAYRHDQISYQAVPGKGSAGDNDFNQVELSGHYLNLFLEWAL